MKDEEIGGWVRAARLYKRWTQAQLASAMEVTAPNISHWEKGHHKPSMKQLMRISRLTGYVLREVSPAEDWPLPRVPYQRLAILEPQQLELLQMLILVALKAMESSDSWETFLRELGQGA